MTNYPFPTLSRSSKPEPFREPTLPAADEDASKFGTLSRKKKPTPISTNPSLEFSTNSSAQTLVSLGVSESSKSMGSGSTIVESLSSRCSTAKPLHIARTKPPRLNLSSQPSTSFDSKCSSTQSLLFDSPLALQYMSQPSDTSRYFEGERKVPDFTRSVGSNSMNLSQDSSVSSPVKHRSKPVEELADNLVLAWTEGLSLVGQLSDGEITEEELRSSAIEEQELVGEGSSGSVYKVQHKITGLVMAKKVIALEGSQVTYQEEAKRYARELSALRHCHSDYIVKYYGAYVDVRDQFLYLFTEFCEMGNFQGIAQRVEQCGQIFPEWILQNVARCVIRGLIYLYQEHRLIHRDIKPSNILMGDKGDIKLCDLGVSRELSSSSNADTFVGTSLYMAPERIRGMRHSSQSDVWSLGITLYELAEGRLPYPSNISILELLQCIVCDPIPALSPGRSEDFQNFVQKCCVKSSEERPTASAIVDLDMPFIAGSGSSKDNIHWLYTLL